MNNINILIIKNFSLEIYNNLFISEGLKVSYLTIDEVYEKEQQYIMNFNYIIVWLNFNYLVDEINSISLGYNNVFEKIVSKCDNLINYIKINKNIFWVTFEDFNNKKITYLGNSFDYIPDSINCHLYLNYNKYIFFADIKKTISMLKVKNVYNLSGNYRWNIPYKKTVITSVIFDFLKYLKIEMGQTKKCVVLDCDNVLWGGNVSDLGVEGIKLSKNGIGKQYYDFQKFILDLYNHGVIIAIASKNDVEDVINVFETHDEMIIKREHISVFYVNWHSKVENIKKISQNLKIGVDSIVFIDDSEFEINLVKSQIPEVTCIKFNENFDYNIIKCFNLKMNYDINVINQRTKTYQMNFERERLREKIGNFQEYIKSLEMIVDIHPTVDVEYGRISELSQRTNRCTNGLRFTYSDIQNEVKNNKTVFFTVKLKDKFSDLGIVGAFAIRANNLILLCVSCRALGRNIEKTIVKYISDNFTIKEILYENTSKNDHFLELINTYLENKK